MAWSKNGSVVEKGGSFVVCVASCVLSPAISTHVAMPIQAQEETSMHVYLGIMQTVASPCRLLAAALPCFFLNRFCSVHDGDRFSAIPELPPIDCLPLPGSTLPISLTARFAKDSLLRASASRPPLLRIACLQQRQDGSDVIDQVVMLCAVRPLTLMQEHPIHHASPG